jgi:hypothetical protein
LQQSLWMVAVIVAWQQPVVQGPLQGEAWDFPGHQGAELVAYRPPPQQIGMAPAKLARAGAA